MGPRSRSPHTIWAYAYQIAPPPAGGRLRAIRALLEREHSAARRGPRTWTGRLIAGARRTRILIVTDSLALSRRVDRRLEGELKEMEVAFSVTEPLAVAGDPGGHRPAGHQRPVIRRPAPSGNAP